MKLSIALMICSLLLGIFSPVLAGRKDIDLTVEGEVLSARLQGIPLKIILEKLERERGIWFRGHPSLLEEDITVQFTNLPVEEGLKRILASINYSLIFDGNERLVGVIVIGKGGSGGSVSEGKAGSPRRTISPLDTNEQDDMDRSLAGIGEYQGDSEVMGNYSQFGGPAEVAEEAPDNFEVMRNSPPPGSPGETATGDRNDFTVVRNCTPPDGPAHGTGENPDGFTVMENCPPPGGPIKVDVQMLEENFKVIRNCPPPGS